MTMTMATQINYEKHEQTFDYLVLATHADQALKILNDASDEERNILSKFKYTKNKAYLHSDKEMMPRNKKIPRPRAHPASHRKSRCPSVTDNERRHSGE